MPARVSAALVAAAGLAHAAAAQVTLHDNFDCYDPGAPISSLGAWDLWPGGLFTQDAYVTDRLAFSGPHSLHLDQQYVDVLHELRSIEGRITYSMMTYVPGESVGMDMYIAALNTHGHPASSSWSIQVKFDTDAGTLDHGSGGPPAPMVFDRWAEWRAEIDTAANTYDLYYDGELWAAGLPWTGGPFGSGRPYFDAINLYVDQLASGPGMYIDDVLVAPTDAIPPPTCTLCYADCDGSGEVDFFDFLCFQNLFGAGDPRADCDQDGDLSFFDFLCFQTQFAAGCP